MKKNVCTALLSASLVTMIGLGGASFVHPTVAFAGDKDQPSAEVIARDKERMDKAVESIKSEYPKIADQIDGYYKKFNCVPDIYSDHYKQYVKESSDATPEDMASAHDELANNEAAIQEAIDQARSELDEYAATKIEEAKNTGLFDDIELNRFKRSITRYKDPDAFRTPYGRIEEPQNTLESVDEYKKEYKSSMDEAVKDWIAYEKESIELQKELGPLWVEKRDAIEKLDRCEWMFNSIDESGVLSRKDKQQFSSKYNKILDQAKDDIKKSNNKLEIHTIGSKAHDSLEELRLAYSKKIYEIESASTYKPELDEFFAEISKPMTPEEYKQIIDLANEIENGTKATPDRYRMIAGYNGWNAFDVAIHMTPYAEAKLTEYGRPDMPTITDIEKRSSAYDCNFREFSRGHYKNAIEQYKKAHAVADKEESTQNIAKSKISAEPKHMKKSATPNTADVTAGVAAYLLGGLGLGLVSRKKN